ncbi:hypothetical protein PAESOLCIP111_00113 [Paenibacillus solanacearum]|uniref:DUF3221 domain-containing protein n=1 Tax=Paenibacillus solanacearum TaxID=2048548 RepID=A0A916JRU4_9BACL|nr:DUF3221 domain-containing protein [Paenibacillus solanacearum]CAG7597043.1 hypothetical protein PAESOLCIP111_00113 [Paenibacillus solanacearum]
MRNIVVLCIVITSLLLTAACSKQVEHIGIVTDIHEKRILVSGIENKNNSIWFTSKKMLPPEVRVGSKVKIIFDGVVATSYPGQAFAQKIIVMNEE